MNRHQTSSLPLLLTDTPFGARAVKMTPGPLAGELSGSLGNTVFARNKGGAYMRTRVSPTNPNSVAQQRARADFNSAVQRWTNTLTSVQRATWELYAANVTVTDRLGAQIQLSGQQHYVRTNSASLLCGAGFIDTAPGIFDTGEPPTGVLIDASDFTDPSMDVNFDNGAWADEDGSFLILGMKLPTNTTVNQQHVRETHMGTVAGNSVTPPAQPDTFNPTPFGFAVGNSLRLTARILRADGRLSEKVLTPAAIAE